MDFAQFTENQFVALNLCQSTLGKSHSETVGFGRDRLDIALVFPAKFQEYGFFRLPQLQAVEGELGGCKRRSRPGAQLQNEEQGCCEADGREALMASGILDFYTIS